MDWARVHVDESTLLMGPMYDRVRQHMSAITIDPLLVIGGGAPASIAALFGSQDGNLQSSRRRYLNFTQPVSCSTSRRFHCVL
jgi:hypothetical protein